MVKMTLEQKIGERTIYAAIGISYVIAAPIVLPLITVLDYATRRKDKSRFNEVVRENVMDYFLYTGATLHGAFCRWPEEVNKTEKGTK